jgi:hypothetical protein
MNSKKTSASAWKALRNGLAAGATATVPKTKYPHPLDAGAHRTSTWPVGQLADYTFAGPSDEAPMVVREYHDRFEVFLEGVRLTTTAAKAAQNNPTAAMYLGGALLGGAIGTSVSNRREGALVGAGLGLLFAALLESSLADQSARRG